MTLRYTNVYLFGDKMTKYIFLLAVMLSTVTISAKTLPVCFYVSSYHQGFVWSDGIEKAIYKKLENKCEIVQFNMDTKRYKDEVFKEAQALNVKNMIEAIKPDIVITSDDNAAKYVIKKYFKDSSIPFIFCGVNWTVEQYGFPYSNVTGMIEVTPIKQVFVTAKDILQPTKAIFIGDNTITDKKDLARFETDAKLANIQLDNVLVDTVKQWKEAYLKAQNEYDFIILGHNAAIKDWDDEDVKQFIYKNTKKLSLTTYTWMMEFSTIGFTILSTEQGEWAADSALAILNGYAIKDISITTNKQWDIWLNTKIQKISNITIPKKIRQKAKKIK